MGAAKRVMDVPKWVGGRYVDTATEAFGRVPDEATERVRDVPKFAARSHAGGANGAFGGTPMGPRNV